MNGVAEQPRALGDLPAGFEPRDYQQRIVADALEHFAGDGTSVLVESPTGSGKTVMGLLIAQAIQQQRSFRVGWCAMRRNLLIQVHRENARGFGVDLVPISMFDKHPPAADLLVIDEAQHDGALSMANLHGQIKPKLILGLSATPFRTDRVRLCFEKTLRDAGIERLIDDGYLAPYHHYALDSHEPDRVAQVYSDDQPRWGKALIFFHTRAQCEACQAAMQRLGVRSEVVTAQTDRERQIADFDKGRLDVLINMLLLIEGFDCPSLQTVFCRASGKLPTIQMAGRVLRQHPGIAHKNIVQPTSTKWPFPRTAAPREQYLWSDDGWRAVMPNARLDAICNRMQGLLAHLEPQLPKYIIDRPQPAADNHQRWARMLSGAF
ncbi:MAG: DEAD/DEAH box helicase family protein [Planctomycetota bacterium]